MLLETPDIRQKSNHDCGEAAFKIMTSYWELKVKRLAADPHDGIHPFDLEPALRRSGLRTISGSMNIADLKHHQSQQRPVICLIRVEGGGHWVVVRGVTRTRVHVQDPDRGRVWFTHKDWLDQWSDQDRHGTEFRNHGVAAWL